MATQDQDLIILPEDMIDNQDQDHDEDQDQASKRGSRRISAEVVPA